MIYLASPLFALEEYKMAHRYGATKYWVNRLQQTTNEWVYSPILHYYEMAKQYNLPKDHVYWKSINHQAIDICNELWILMLPCWEKSQGIADEIAYAKQIGKKIVFLLIEDGKLTILKNENYL